MSEPAITLTDVTKAYGAHLALNAVNLTIAKGQFVALVGSSGSGKTSLLKVINRLVTPDTGQIAIAGVAADLPDHELRRTIGYVFQDIGLFPHMTVAENIAITPRLLGWDADRRATRVNELLTLVSLPLALAGRLPGELSGGQRQRVGVARALAARPAMLLMDEPFGALDPITREGLRADIRAIHDQLGLTTVMVTHDMAEAVLLSDRLIILEHGAIVADGTPEALAGPGSDAGVRALLDGPRLQAERLSARLAGALA